MHRSRRHLSSITSSAVESTPDGTVSPSALTVVGGWMMLSQAREKCSVRQVNMTISLAFLAPNLVKAAVEGRLPRGIGIERLRDPPTEWSRQFKALGLNPE
jgi:hypothetical protein